MRTALIGWTLVALVWGLPLAASAGDCYEDLTVAQAVAMLDGSGEAPVILDVRSPEEFYGRGGHIDGAILVPVDQLAGRLEELEALRDREVIVVCHSGNRSSYAARFLCDRGFTGLHNLAGGMNGWARAGQPVKGTL